MSNNGSHEISKAYRHATNLYLTLRLPEALAVVETLVSPDSSGLADGTAAAKPALIASAPKKLRIKVWSLYMSIINALLELGSDEGKQVLGSQNWRELAAKARGDGLWSEIVNAGYNGIEGNVDAEVIINLVNLLLGHAPSQIQTQHRLENYLSATSATNLDFSEHLYSHDGGKLDSYSVHRPGGSGTNTPRDLNSRIKILELYTIHVLPRNEEWDYAREFINLSDVLDEETREVFLQSLQSLKDEKYKTAAEDAEIESSQTKGFHRMHRDESTETVRKITETPSPLDTRQKPNLHARVSSSETDYGIESQHLSDTATEQRPEQTPIKRPPNPSQPRQKLSPATKAGKRQAAPAGFVTQASSIMASMHNYIAAVARSLKTNPLMLLRTLLFIVGLLMALSRKEIRDRIRRITAAGWDKMKGTVGMGVKVSYL
ncbi:MAG: hypothetical protein M1829_001921 [Trizodia sp. TS-e1964]|nr:MAG: hypothetical protein M1829_001921 [Trizodia sp. TS-e1964]